MTVNSEFKRIFYDKLENKYVKDNEKIIVIRLMNRLSFSSEKDI